MERGRNGDTYIFAKKYVSPVVALEALLEEERRLLLSGTAEADALVFDADWESWVREGQAPPAGAWRQ